MFVCAGFAFLPAVLADTFETRWGKIYEGKVLDEDKAYVYIDLPTGQVVNVLKTELLSVNGEPYQYSGQGTAPLKPGKPLPYLGAVSPDYATACGCG